MQILKNKILINLMPESKNEVKNAFNEIENMFTNLESEYVFLRKLENSHYLIKPESIPVGQEMQINSTGIMEHKILESQCIRIVKTLVFL